MSRVRLLGVYLLQALALALVFSLAWAASPAPASAAAKYNLKIGGTTIGGAFYPVAAAIGQVLNEKVPQFNVTVETTPGAGANIRLLDTGDIDVGLSVTPVTYYAYEGRGKWKKKYDVRSLMTFFPNAMTFIVLKSSSIRSIADLKGKGITAGGPGAQWQIFMGPILSLYNMTFKDFSRVLYMGQSAAANALKDGVVDAAFLGGGDPNIAPTPSLASLESTNEFRPLLPPADKLDELSRKYPFLGKIKVRGGVYKGQPRAAYWPDCGSMQLVVNAKADPEMVYQLVKAIYEHREEIAAINPLARDLTPAHVAIRTGTPYHPGAIRYYREHGLWKR